MDGIHSPVETVKPVIRELMTEDANEIVGIRPARYISLNGNGSQVIDGAVIDEAMICVSVNGVELATFMCTPRNLMELAIGFLYNEGIINQLEDIRSRHISQNGTCVDVWLHDMEFERPRRAIITAGCGGGLTFNDLSAVYSSMR